MDDCQVTANVKTVRDDESEYHAVQVAASNRPEKTTTKQMLGHFRKAGVLPKRIVKEFPVTPDAHVPVGMSRRLLPSRIHTQRYIRNNSVGDSFCSRTICRRRLQFVRKSPLFIEVHLTSSRIGKGFQGTMKRWNFKGLRASHGVSVSHRAAGAIGAHQVIAIILSRLATVLMLDF